MQTQQEIFNQGLAAAAHQHGESEVLAELAKMDERRELAMKRRAESPVVVYEAGEERVSLETAIIRTARPVALLSMLAGGVYLVVVVFASIAGAVMAFVAENALIVGGVGFGVVVILLGVGSIFSGNGGESVGSGGRTSSTAQNINVTVNVSGGNVNTHGKQ